MCALYSDEDTVQSVGCNLSHGGCRVLLRLQEIFVTPSGQRDLLSYFLLSHRAS